MELGVLCKSGGAHLIAGVMRQMFQICILREIYSMSSNNEPKWSVWFHVIIPTITVICASGLSLYLDFLNNGEYLWFQRSGALMGAAGIYIGFHEVGWKLAVKDGDIFINTEIWYQWLSLALGIIGTLIWAYGDLIFK